MTEQKVQAGLKELMKGRTTFVIAHRLATIRDADLVLVLDKGKLVECGSYRELISMPSAFANLVAAQQGAAVQAG